MLPASQPFGNPGPSEVLAGPGRAAQTVPHSPPQDLAWAAPQTRLPPPRGQGHAPNPSHSAPTRLLQPLWGAVPVHQARLTPQVGEAPGHGALATPERTLQPRQQAALPARPLHFCFEGTPPAVPSAQVPRPSGAHGSCGVSGGGEGASSSRVGGVPAGGPNRPPSPAPPTPAPGPEQAGRRREGYLAEGCQWQPEAQLGHGAAARSPGRPPERLPHDHSRCADALSPAAFACWFSHRRRLLPLRPADFQEMMPAW